MFNHALILDSRHVIKLIIIINHYMEIKRVLGHLGLGCFGPDIWLGIMPKVDVSAITINLRGGGGEGEGDCCMHVGCI